MISNSIDSIKSQLYQRAASPLIGSFFISWCIVNYKALLVMFSDNTYLQKFDYIETTLYPSVEYIIFLGILSPLTISFIYIFLVPYPELLTFKYTLRRKQELIDAKQDIEKKTLLTVEQSIAIREEIDELNRKFKNISDKKDEEIKNHKDYIEKQLTKKLELEDSLKATKIELESKKNELLNLQDTVNSIHDSLPARDEISTNTLDLKEDYIYKLLHDISETNGISLEKLIIRYKDKSEARHHIDALLDEGWIKNSSMLEGATSFIITRKGNIRLLEKNRNKSSNKENA